MKVSDKYNIDKYGLGAKEQSVVGNMGGIIMKNKTTKWVVVTIGIAVMAIAVIAVILFLSGKGDAVNTYITITDTRIDNDYFTMTVPEDFVGKVSYAVVVEDVNGEVKPSQDFSVIFVVDELAFGTGEVSGEGTGEEVVSREITYGASRNGTLGGISWWTIEDLGWMPDEKKEYESFAEYYQEYYPEYAIGFEGELLQTDAEGTGGYCATNPTDVQWGVGDDDLETYYEMYSHLSQELDEARKSFDSKTLE